MPKQLSLSLTLAALTLTLASCDDPELVRKRDQQRAEIQKLEGELNLLREQLKDAPPDRTAELKELQEKVASEKEEISNLEAEVAGLEARKRELDKEIADYKRKYPLR